MTKEGANYRREGYICSKFVGSFGEGIEAQNKVVG
jgi:hypothetical protein